MTSKITAKIGGPLGFIFAGAILVSFSSVFVKWANVGPTVSAFYRMLFGGGVLFAIAYLRQGSVKPAGLNILWGPLIAAFFFALDLFFWHRSIIHVGPGLATLLGNCQVFFVALIAILFLKEKINWQRALSIPLAMGGLYLVLGFEWGSETESFKLGVLFGLLTAFTYALYILVLRHSQSQQHRLSAILNMGYIGLFAAFMLGISALFEGESFAIPDLQTWGSLVGLAILSQVVGWVLISRGLPKVDASAAGIALLIQPALAFVWDILIFSRVTTPVEFVGIGITLGAIYLGSTGKKRTD